MIGYFLKLGATGYAGPVALVAYMERDLLEKKRWVSEEEFKLGIALSQATPGPMAAQMAMWIGYLKGGALGALATGSAFILIPFVIVLVLARLYVQFEGLWWIEALFRGFNPAVLAIIILSAARLTRKMLGSKKLLWAIGAMILGGTLMSCQKSEKETTAGGGSSTQSIMTFRGATQ